MMKESIMEIARRADAIGGAGMQFTETAIGGVRFPLPDRPERPHIIDEIEKTVAVRAGKISDARTAALADATSVVDRMAERIGQPRGVIRYDDMSDAQEIADILMRVYARDIQTIVGVK